MRGKVTGLTKYRARKGITPAYAGKSRKLSACRRKRQDHPRLCGEKFQQRATLPALKGSPPPMRGKVSSM